MKPTLPPQRQSSTTGSRLVERVHSLIRPTRKKSYRLSANVTGEDDWEVDEPQIRMSRAFAVMLVLHLVAVGGLFAFHMFGRDDHEAETLAANRANETAPPASAPLTTPAVAALPAPRLPVVPEPVMESHLLKSGESKMLIAAKFGITVRELEEANTGVDFKAGTTLTIPQHQREIGALASTRPTGNKPLALVVATPSDDVAHREFAVKREENDPYAPVLAAEIAPAPRVAAVKAEPVEGHEDEAEPAPAEPAPAVASRTPKPAPAAPVPAKPKPATGSRTHVIQKGDTIYNVAKRYSLSPGEIMRANGISDPSRLQMGQVLKITVKR
jgi:LysM repeat protein